ncbi:cytoskeleton assembly control protein [Cryptococcus neoformans]|nr:cytoskeleton assembly control protein [Cryptococcus neoformans var. grubii Bt1]OXG24848.1 cytoskeleton assembly control protein [Cryptococcus neoformans var. grubii Ze90-1]OXH31759.1 cytoskeleton assembly control protein [Cryptococcus neoformans var. grubii]
MFGRHNADYDDYPTVRAAASGSSHQPTRPVDKEKTEAELSVNIKKATSPEETAPKQKHVRKCIVYTWDYHSSLSVWNGLRTQPILADEVQTFKALIVVHKLLQEGHPVTLKEAHAQTGWLETCGRTVGDSGKGYGALIKAYTSFLLAKLRFHRHHPEFNGLFEYEEYISLKNIDDPNEGYETITDLMTLQDQIESFQKLIFAHFRGSANNECRISALVPLVKESFGIYKFITSMLRAMHRRTDAADALLPLRERYNAQHYNLRRFYYECSNLKYLTGLINVPKLGQEPPNLIDNGVAPELPERPTTDKRPERKETPRPSSPQATQGEIDEQRRMLEEYERKQSALVAQRESDQRRQEEEKRRQEAEYAEQQRLQQERETQAQHQLQEQLLRDQMSQQWTQQQAGQAAQLQQEMLAMRGQYERDQMLLEQYDRRVKALEQELGSIGVNIGAQMSAKDDLIAQLQQQIETWKNKYEALAKLYSQLRTEHLDLLNKTKGFQLKANSAQEAVDKMERMERDVKAKNLELADMIRERDRARYDLDRLKSSHREETDRIKRDLAFANERAEDASRHKSSEVSDVMSRYNRQLTELEDSLRAKQLQIDDLLRKLDEKQAEVQHVMDEKEQELAIMQEGMDSTLKQLGDLKLTQGETNQALDAQIDTLILDHRKELNVIIDSILQACMQKVDDAIYELEAPMQTGNTTATPEYTLSMIEKAMTNATEFASTFNLYLSKKSGGGQVDVIKTANEFCQALCETLVSSKGITRFAETDDSSEKLVKVAKDAGDAGYRFFLNLQSFRLLAGGKNEEAALRNNAETRSALSKLSDTVEKFVPKAKTTLTQANGDIGDIVTQEMQNAAKAIEEATQRIQVLMARPKNVSKYDSLDIQVHDAILQATLAITNAIGRLIQAATESQEEIVKEGKGTSTTQQFYKRNNRWTEGLISAAKAVAYATGLLIESADGVISGTHSLEQLIVASNEVSAATAQLVAASRVKASLMSKSQQLLELAAKAVTDACKALVKQVKLISNKQSDDEVVDYKSMPSHEFKVREMEQQVEILKLEKELGAARRRLGEMRRAGYHQETD